MRLKNIFVLLIGAALFIGWHFFSNQVWEPISSYDILSGAIIEFFIFTYLLSESEKRQELARNKELDAHLNKIEQLIKKAYAKL
jgi:uncharacterized membrane protein